MPVWRHLHEFAAGFDSLGASLLCSGISICCALNASSESWNGVFLYFNESFISRRLRVQVPAPPVRDSLNDLGRSYG